MWKTLTNWNLVKHLSVNEKFWSQNCKKCTQKNRLLEVQMILIRSRKTLITKKRDALKRWNVALFDYVYFDVFILLINITLFMAWTEISVSSNNVM